MSYVQAMSGLGTVRQRPGGDLRTIALNNQKLKMIAEQNGANVIVTEEGGDDLPKWVLPAGIIGIVGLALFMSKKKGKEKK